MQKITPTQPALLRIERSGRHGKTVTVVERLPRSSSYVEELARHLKSRCGSGGTSFMKPEGGVIEIQGDKREQLRGILRGLGFEIKG